MSENSPKVVVDRTNKLEPKLSGQGIYHQGSGVTLAAYDGVPYFSPVEGGANVTVLGQDGKNTTEFKPSGTVLIYENDEFKHVVTIK